MAGRLAPRSQPTREANDLFTAFTAIQAPIVPNRMSR